MSDEPTPRAIVQIVPELLRARDAALLLGMSEAGFKQLARAGRIGPPPIRLGAKLVRWSRRELVAWVEAGCPSREQWVEQSMGQTADRPRLAESA